MQLEALLRRMPAVLPALLPTMLEQAAVARNEHLRLEAFHLLVVSLKVRSGQCMMLCLSARCVPHPL